MSKTGFWKSNKGTSLVEVLVVMVVLLVGIMTVIQMFPTGFRVVKAAESQTIATRLAQKEVERWKNMSANLPSCILPIDEYGNVINDQFAGPPFEAFAKDNKGHWKKQGDKFVRGNALNYRQVVGETVVIPSPSHSKTGGGSYFGSRYNVAFGPIDVIRVNGRLDGLAVKGADLTPMHVSDTVSLASFDLQPGEFAVSADKSGRGNIKVAFPEDGGVYYVSYSYWAIVDGKKTLISKLDQEITPDTKNAWVTVPVTVSDNASLVNLEPGSISCAPGFREQPDTWTGNPYEFKLADPILGTIVLNPAGYGGTARVDYRIQDPRILHEDKVIPPSQIAKIPIKLPLRFVLDAGKPDDPNDGTPTDNPDEPTFEGLMRDANGILMVDRSILIADLSTGLLVDQSEVEVEFDAGVVYLPQSANLNDWDGKPVEHGAQLSGRHLRFFYRAEGDWSVMCQKANTTYERVEPNDGIDYSHFRLVEPNRLVFAPSEGEKTVVVDFSYGRPGAQGSAEGEHRIAGQSYQVQMDLNNGDWVVDLPLPEGYEIKRISVVGTSFRTRVVWRDANRWRYVDMDTSLVRGNSV